MTDEEKQRENVRSVELAQQMAQILIGNTVTEVFMAISNLVASSGGTIRPENPYKWVLDVARYAADILDENNGGHPTGKLNS